MDEALEYRVIATRSPERQPRTISDIKVFDSLPKPFKRGPFRTKSSASLLVNFAPELGEVILMRFLEYDQEEVDLIGRPMITIREYEVNDIPDGNTPQGFVYGGTEFHRIREEVIMCTAGKLLWTFEDAYGEKLETTLAPGDAVWIPPFILHTYLSLQDGSCLKVLCNTFLYPDDPETSDTYSEELFRELQANCA